MQKELRWQHRVGHQREWIWRGWSIRYSFYPHSSHQPPLILLHGFGAAIEHWRKNIPVLGEYTTIYALDFLGFGGSRKADTPYTINLWVEQVYDFWRRFIGQPVVLVGNSLGSLVGLTLAASYPEMVKGLVMLSLPDVASRQEMLPKPIEPLVRQMENLVANSGLLSFLFYFLRRPAVIRRWAAIAYRDETLIDEELIEIIANPPQETEANRAFCALFRSVIRPNFAQSAKELLPKLTIPMLLLWGKQDRMVPAFLAPQFAQLNPRLKLIELDEVGHCLHDECPERFNPLLLTWLKAHFDQAQ